MSVRAVSAAVGAPLVGVTLLGYAVIGDQSEPNGYAGDGTAAGYAAALEVVSALALRVLSAKTVGANIGAGMVLLAWPVAAILLLSRTGRALRGDEG